MSAIQAAEDDIRMRFALSLRRSGVTDARVMAALERTPRHLFAPPGLAASAWEDCALSLPGGGAMTSPSDLARLFAAAWIGPSDIVLEIGTGSGYGTAALARLAARVVSVERAQARVENAAQRLAGLGIANVDLRHADGLSPYAELGAFTRIIVDGSVPIAPAALLTRLLPGGVAVLALGGSFDQRLFRFREARGEAPEELGSIRLDPLLPGLA